MLVHPVDDDVDPSRLVYTFGGVEPVASASRPGTVLSTSTLDCFAGRVRSTADLVSEVCDPRLHQPADRPVLRRGGRTG